MTSQKDHSSDANACQQALLQSLAKSFGLRIEHHFHPDCTFRPAISGTPVRPALETTVSRPGARRFVARKASEAKASVIKPQITDSASNEAPPEATQTSKKTNKQTGDPNMKQKQLILLCAAVLALAGCDSGIKPAGEQPASTNPPPAASSAQPASPESPTPATVPAPEPSPKPAE